MIRHNKMLIIITGLCDYSEGLLSDNTDHVICKYWEKYFQIFQTVDQDIQSWGPGATSSAEPGIYLWVLFN